MHRKFFSLLVFLGLGFAVGGMACLDTQFDLDVSDETDGATG